MAHWDKLYVILDLSRTTVFAEVIRILTRNLIVLGLFALFALAIAWFGGDVLLLRPIKVLVRATERLAAGDLRTRTGLPNYGKDEVSQLAHAFDQMAESVELSVAGRKQVTETLQASEAELRALFASMTDVILVLDSQGRYLEIAPTNPALLYKPQAELIGKTLREVFPSTQTDTFLGFIRRALETQETVNAEYSMQIGEATIWFAAAISRMRADAVIWVARDITQRKQSEEALRTGIERLELLYHLGLNLSASLDIREVAQQALVALCSAVGSHSGAILMRDQGDLNRLRIVAASGYDKDSVDALDRQWQAFPRSGLIGWVAAHRQSALVGDVSKDERWAVIPGLDDWVRSTMNVPLVARDELVGVLVTSSDQVAFFTEDHLQLAQSVAAGLAAAMTNTRLYAEATHHALEMETLNKVGQELSATLNLEEVIEHLGKGTRRLLEPGNFSVSLYDDARGEFEVKLYMDRGQRKPGFRIPIDQGLVSQILTHNEPILAADYLRECERRGVQAAGPGDPAKAWLGVPIAAGSEVLGALVIWDYESESSLNEQDLRLLSTLSAQAAIAIKNARLHEEVLHRLAELEAVSRISTALRVALNIGEMLPILLDETLGVLKANAGTIWLHDPAENVLRQTVNRGFPDVAFAVKVGEGLTGQVFVTGQPYVSREFKSDPLGHPSIRLEVEAGLGGGVIPIRTADQVVGVLFVAVELPRTLTADDVRLLSTLAEMAGNAIQRMQLHEQTVQYVQRLSALRAIDIAISSNLDLRVTLGVLLDQVATQLGADASDVLLLDPLTQMLEFSVGRGFRSPVFEQTRLRLGEGHAGRSALERQSVAVLNLRENPGEMTRSQWLTGEGFVTYHCMPLIAQGQVKGVLETFNRSSLNPDPEWLGFLQALGQQAAIAIDNAELFEGLQRSNAELALAYDATLEGWSSALDLRDKETEGHSHRVTEISVRLARAMGIGEAELVHVRRGALLHDIGKMGIPDGILLKPGKLSEEEWEIMRRHPVYAFKLLSPIAYLYPAIDIPYCHHEKWDGTGYPRGLKGEEIPLAARLFAIVDVWDALRSDRPYRAAWSEEKVREHLHDLSDKHFDPKIVEVFLSMKEEEH